jgi:hypothetical protein
MGYLLITSMWIAYCFLHSFLVSTSFTNLLARSLKNYYAFYRIFFVSLSLILLIPLIRYTDQLDSNIFITYSPLLNIVRYMLILGSLLMFFCAFFIDYDSLSFFGIRQILGLREDKEDKFFRGFEKKWTIRSSKTSDVFCFNSIFMVPDFHCNWHNCKHSINNLYYYRNNS